MELIDLIKTRRSVRRYNSRRVETEKIRALLEGAIWAPSGSNLQLWHFVVVQDAAALQKIKLFSPGMSRSAPCIIALCIDLAEAEAKGGALARDSLAPMDTAFTAQNILLMAHHMGLGACVVKSYNHSSVKRLLGLPGRVAPLLLISVGYYDSAPQAPPRRPVAEKIHFEGW